MDTIQFSEDKFVVMAETLIKKAITLGFKADQVIVIPGPFFDGGNLVDTKSELFPWYQGPTLLEYCK